MIKLLITLCIFYFLSINIAGQIKNSTLSPEAEREAKVLEVGFADGCRVGGKRIGHGGMSGSGHFAAIIATVVSSMRLENPHSLSYQAETLTSRPDTFVSVASNVDDAGSWLKSTDTSGPVL